MVSISRLEVVFSKSNLCLGGVIVVPGDGGLVDDRSLFNKKTYLLIYKLDEWLDSIELLLAACEVS